MTAFSAAAWWMVLKCRGMRFHSQFLKVYHEQPFEFYQENWASVETAITFSSSFFNIMIYIDSFERPVKDGDSEKNYFYSIFNRSYANQHRVLFGKGSQTKTGTCGAEPGKRRQLLLTPEPAWNVRENLTIASFHTQTLTRGYPNTEPVNTGPLKHLLWGRTQATV